MKKEKTIGLLGGTGFLGSQLTLALSGLGHRIRIPSRHPERFRHLEVLPGVSLTHENIMDAGELQSFLKGADVVINLIGVLNDSKKGGFDKVNAAFPAEVAQACQELGIYRMIHFSALNADAETGASHYLKSKGEGEARLWVFGEDMDITVFRPNVVFGADDQFFNRFATLLGLLPVFPLAGANTRFAPVYVGDVVEAVVCALQNKRCYGEAYDLCGPSVYRLKDLVAYIALKLRIEKPIIETGGLLSTLQAIVLERLPGQLLTRDNLRSLSQDCLSDSGEVFWNRFAITPTALESIVPTYLNAAHKKTHYDHLRLSAGR